MISKDLVNITNTTKNRLPRLSFESIKDAILGKNYELSIAVVGSSRMTKLNLIYRNKKGSTDVLSFGLEKNSGEIVFDLEKVRSKAKLHDLSFEKYFKKLFIHGLLHLKGFEHGSRMKVEELKFENNFN